jgi:hypothetical protein
MVNTDSCIEHLVQSDGLALKLARGTEDVTDLQEKGLSLLKHLEQKDKDQLWHMWKKMAKSANTKSTDHSVKDTAFAALFPYYIDALIDETTESRLALVNKATNLNKLVSKSIERNRDSPFPIDIVSWIKNSDEASEQWVGFTYIPFYQFFENLPKAKIDKLSGYSTRTGKVQRTVRDEIGYTAFLQDSMIKELRRYTPLETPSKTPTNYSTDVFRIWRVYTYNPKLFPYLLKSIQPQGYRVVFWTVVLHTLKELRNSDLKTILHKIQTTMAQLLKSQDVPEIKTTTPSGDTALPRYPSYKGDLLRTTKLKEVMSDQNASYEQATRYHLAAEYQKKLVKLKQRSAEVYANQKKRNDAIKTEAKELDPELDDKVKELKQYALAFYSTDFGEEVEKEQNKTKRHILIWGRFAQYSVAMEEKFQAIVTQLDNNNKRVKPDVVFMCDGLEELKNLFEQMKVKIYETLELKE